jgi:exosortase A-associated hydrolase 2
MNAVAAQVSAKPFFLKSGDGQRFCLLYSPVGDACKGAFLYVHPFGEEMNKSRRMAALQAREFAANGYAVLQIDLLGCGDSSGEFGDASWNAWKDDLALAQQWLTQEFAAPVCLWGLRLGGLLALDYAQSAQVEHMLLWHPVLSGSTFLTQLLRLRVANAMLSDDKEKNGGGTQALRDALQSGETLEIAGYDITPHMAKAMDALDASKLTPTCPINWIEVVSAEGRAMTPASARVANSWQQHGVEMKTHTVACLQFWATQEISECPELLTQTTAILPALFSHPHPDAQHVQVSHAI